MKNESTSKMDASYFTQRDKHLTIGGMLKELKR